MSSSYWRKREQDWKNSNKKSEEDYIKEIQKIYLNELDLISKEIESFFSRYASKEKITMAEAKKKARKIDIEEYKRKAKKYVEEKEFSDQANEEMRLYNLTMKVNRLELLKANIGLELVNGSNDLETYFGEKLGAEVMAELERNAAILGPSVLNNAKSALVAVNSSFQNATWSDRVWNNQSLLKNNLTNIISNALIQGKNARDFIPDIRKQFDVSRYQAERLLRTELARARIQAQAESYKAENIEDYEYVACGLPDCCKVCKALDGKTFKVKDMEHGENAPPMHPNCHCATAPYMNREEFDEWLNGYKDHGLTFEEWKQSNSLKSVAMGSIGDKKVFITEQAISKVKPVDFEGLKDPHSLQELHKELLKISMLQNNSNEVLTIVDAQNFNKKVISLGEERKVNPNKNIEAISLMQKSGYQSVMWLHNHNRTSDFSYDDLGCFYNEKVKALTIVTNKGKVTVLNKTKNYDITKFYSIIIEERDKYSNAIDHADDIAKAIVKRHNEYGVQWIR